MTNTHTEREQLEQRRQELITRLQAIEKDYRRGLSADSEERALELENAETLAEIARVTQAELDKVEAALRQHEST